MKTSGAFSELLNEMNPSLKGLTVILGVILLSFAFDPITISVSLIYVLMVTVIFGRISWRRWLLLFLPFFIMAIGYFWTAALFPRSDLPQDSKLLLSWGPLQMTEAGFSLALSLALRTLMFSALSLMFVLTTEPVKFMFSLMQQCKLPPKLAYGILAGFRFLPLFREELRIMQQAHRMRGIWREKRDVRSLLHAFKRYSIPLLASAIRKSERVAVAMVSRGFTGGKRDFYFQMKIRWRDWIFMGIVLSGILLGYSISYALGTLTWYGGQL
ncbi:energy-coupling factor transporter transmembrane component T family protein [Paenibacillus bouchesdurhonensis]|uniref:energy-coupling factor transporter transmembrane component T family protein n=1 Tax=Paenibacillus bouchesdurhonensis TaxID=1870990 RepID=UPI000DA6397E|nr:energy-coupling factor transporter transmembrane component T [Paenibacillus bouchesdurhonensis]